MAAAADQALLASGLRVLLETTLRRYLSLAWVARVQAALLSLSVVAMLGSVATAYSRQVGWAFDVTLQLPTWAFLLPPCLPLWLALGGAHAAGAALGAVLVAALWLAGCVWTAERMVLAGISSGGGPQQGRRGAVIALGVGSLGTDPLEPEPRRRVRVGSVYLFMLLSSLFAYAIYAPSLWTKLVQVVLSALLAYALWQKLRDHPPYLVDPTEAPQPQIGVADGIIAALGFFVLQGVFAFGFNDAGSEGRTLLLAFVCAGSSVTAFALPT